MKMKAKVTQSGPTLCDPMDYTVHGILQARILEWVVRGASSASGKGHEEGGLAYARRDQASGVSLEILEQSTPKTRVCLLSALCFSPTPLTLRGAVPHYLSEKRVSLQLQLIIPGCDSV